MAAALGFEGDLLAALQALFDPLGFGSAIRRKNQGIERLAHHLRGGVAEHPLKLLVHALRTEGWVDHDECIGGAFKKLFEILAADAESFFGTDALVVLLFRMGLFRIPGKRRWLRDWVGDGGWNEGRRGSALQRLPQTSGAHEFPRLRRTGDTTTHLEAPPLEPAMGMVERAGSYEKVTVVIEADCALDVGS